MLFCILRFFQFIVDTKGGRDAQAGDARRAGMGGRDAQAGRQGRDAQADKGATRRQEERGRWKSDEVLVMEEELATAPCANHGCVRLSVDMCGTCNMHHCASHLDVRHLPPRPLLRRLRHPDQPHMCARPEAAATAGDAGGAGAAC